MQRFFPGFPAGCPGGGLLLLRIGFAVELILDGWSHASMFFQTGGTLDAVLGAGFLAAAACVSVGFITPVVHPIVAAFCLWEMGLWLWTVGPDSAGGIWRADLLQLVIALSLLMLGPGGYSIDAMVFGRHEIVIPPRTPSE